MEITHVATFGLKWLKKISSLGYFGLELSQLIYLSKKDKLGSSDVTN